MTDAELRRTLRRSTAGRPVWENDEGDAGRARRLSGPLYLAPNAGQEVCVRARALSQALAAAAETLPGADPDRRAELLIAAGDVTCGKTRAWAASLGDHRRGWMADLTAVEVLHPSDLMRVRCELTGQIVTLTAADLDLAGPEELQPAGLSELRRI